MNKIEAARYLASQVSDRISIADDAEAAPMPHGIMVQGWVYISGEDIDALLADESRIPPALRVKRP